MSTEIQLYSLVVVLFFFFFSFSSSFATESQSILQLQKPHVLESFNVSSIKNYGSCSYSVIVTTSCSSVSYTRDQISISFGDAYGNQIYAPRIDDPSTRAFERCSTDTYRITGPCAYQICYLYLYRSGNDGWMPETVTVSGDNSRPVTFYYRTFIPNNIWYGFNLCGSPSVSHRQATHISLLIATLVFVLLALL